MEHHLVRKDITKMKVDAIMNPTNSTMYGFSGIDKLVHEAGGPEPHVRGKDHRLRG